MPFVRPDLVLSRNSVRDGHTYPPFRLSAQRTLNGQEPLAHKSLSARGLVEEDRRILNVSPSENLTRDPICAFEVINFRGVFLPLRRPKRSASHNSERHRFRLAQRVKTVGQRFECPEL
jgi:hypothetical protein